MEGTEAAGGRRLGQRLRDLHARDGLRVTEAEGMTLRKKGVARVDWRDPYHLAVTLSWPKFFAVLLVVELVINLSFASLYALAPGSVVNARPGSLSDVFFFSIETLATVGYGVMAPGTLYGHIVSAVEILCGMTLTAVFTGLIFVRFSRPKAKILFAENPVITTHNGKPALMVRVGNGRLSPLGDARAKVSVILLEQTEEGHTFWRSHELELVRASIPVFLLTWTVVHEITEASPLWGATPESLEDGDFRMLVSIEVRDQAIASMVCDVHTYGARDIAWRMRYVDAVSWREDNTRTVDMTKLSTVEPDGFSGDAPEQDGIGVRRQPVSS
ncbi:MAG: hypothetical protein JOZ42_13180 [Acetobacteraceae bacterium]|nr:hypothetical protein [Acetobacteraceae bacterium]